MSRLFWYFRADRHANPVSRPAALAIEAEYPKTDGYNTKTWGQRSGEIAAVRWLADEDRQCADDFFPMLDS